MKTGVIMAVVLSGLLPVCGLAGDAGRARFEAANAAYDRGDFPAALADYRGLIAEGHTSAEIWFNAANALFRGGSTGEAVLYYRRAWFMDPRDADIRANMQLAQQRAGALTIPPTLWDRAGQELSRPEWFLLFRIAYWIAIGSAAGAILFRSLRPLLKVVALAAGLAAAAGLGGWLYWRYWLNQREAVVIAAKQTALYEPREKATPFFATPEGSLVRIEETFDSWVKVRSGPNAGWLPRQAVERVYPWQTR